MSDEQPQAIPAVGFLVLAFTEEQAADNALKALEDAKKHKQVYCEDAAVIRQDAAGKVHYRETGDMSTGKGAAAVITDEGVAYEVGVASEEGTVVEVGIVDEEGAVIVDDVTTV